MRYIGIFIVRSCKFKCSLERAKKSFYRAANAAFSKIGRLAFEEVTLQLIKSKCLPVLLYDLEACFLTKSDLQSFDFVINRFFMKLFTTKSIQTVKYCQEYFDFCLPSVLFINFISPNVVANVKQKYAERTDRGRQLQTVSRKQANMQTRQLQLKKILSGQIYPGITGQASIQI